MVSLNQDHPGGKRRRRHLEFISANWLLLARVAYENYLKQGPGMLVLEEKDWIFKPKGVLTEIGIAYLPRGNALLAKLIQDKERGWMESYNPATTILICFLWAAGGESGYRIEVPFPDQTPKAIYERNKA